MLKVINPRAASRWPGATCPLNTAIRLGINTSYSRRNYAKRSLDFNDIDQKWQQKWASQKLESGPELESLQKQDKQEGGKKNMYIQPMFPYPSGQLHLGHLRVYTIADVLSRFRRMQGHKVLHPMGWDAFGLPAENAAIERGIDPAIWTKQNIKNMKSQLQAMNGDWDWDRELATCDPKFYKHTQRIFLMLHERGLAYKAESLVNYDPVDKTVLANEQVDANGYSWRSGAKVEKRMLKQWFLRISEFREALLDDLDHLSKHNLWPERVISMQRNWLGKSEGARIKFPVLSLDGLILDPVEVFTTRPDTLFGVQYVALASTHPIVVELAKNDPDLQTFLNEMPSLPQDSKAGYLLKNTRGINPLAYEESTPEETKKSLPIYVAPYVLGDYGDGAVMGVPGHDARDNAFWKTNCGDEPIRKVVQGEANEQKSTDMTEPYVHRGVLSSNCGPFAGQESKEASQNIVSILGKDANLASVAETWRLRDWLISRQRYWGTPIPIIHCESCGDVAVPEDQLPVKLPTVEGHWLKGKAGNPLEDAHDWVNTTCPKCGSSAKRDTDTMDTFVDSSWYSMRFPDAHNEELPFSPESANQNLPVDLYIGGVEHAILHLLYARFITKFLSTTSLFPPNFSASTPIEPFRRLLTQGMVHGKTYSSPSTGRFLKPDELDLSNPSVPKILETGETATISFEKMSKSKYNGVDPGTCFSKYGADATRAHILFLAPISEVLEWDEEKISGVTRWLRRIHDRVQDLQNITDTINPYLVTPRQYLEDSLPKIKNMEASSKAKQILDGDMELWLEVQKTIISITTSFSETFTLNTVISDLMSLTNTLFSPTSKTYNTNIQYHSLSSLLKLMAPITPAFAEECWELLHLNSLTREGRNSVFKEIWPEQDGTLEVLKKSTRTCAVQVNGKLRFVFELEVPPDRLQGRDLEEWVIERLVGCGEGKGKLGERGWRKVVVVGRGRTVNLVV